MFFLPVMSCTVTTNYDFKVLSDHKLEDCQTRKALEPQREEWPSGLRRCD